MVLTPEGNEALTKYVGSLVQLYLDKGVEEYPLDMSKEWIGVLGLPRVPYQFRFRSQDELWGRILAYGHLLGAIQLIGDGDTYVEVRL